MKILRLPRNIAVLFGNCFETMCVPGQLCSNGGCASPASQLLENLL